MYRKDFFAGWGDMDFNSHMRNTAFLDRAADVRMLFFSEHGFPMREFQHRRLGPVVMKDEVEYFREVALLQAFQVSLALAGMAPDGSRFRLRNDFHHADHQLVARVSSTGGWLDLKARKLIQPPPELLAALSSLPRTEDFCELPSSWKGTPSS